MPDEIVDDELQFEQWPFRGQGGQRVTDTKVGVAVYHARTGTGAICNSERSMQANRERAVAMLHAMRAAQLTALRQPQTATAGIAAIFGQWPGDETDEEVAEAMRRPMAAQLTDEEIEALRDARSYLVELVSRHLPWDKPVSEAERAQNAAHQRLRRAVRGIDAALAAKGGR